MQPAELTLEERGDECGNLDFLHQGGWALGLDTPWAWETFVEPRSSTLGKSGVEMEVA